MSVLTATSAMEAPPRSEQAGRRTAGLLLALQHRTHRQVAGLLHCPVTGRVGGDTSPAPSKPSSRGLIDPRSGSSQPRILFSSRTGSWWLSAGPAAAQRLPLGAPETCRLVMVVLCCMQRENHSHMEPETRYQEGYAKLPAVILLHRPDLRFRRSLILGLRGFA